MFIAAAAALYFQVFAADRVNDDGRVVALKMNAAQVRNVFAVQIAHILDKRAGGAGRQRKIGGAERAESARGKYLAQRAFGARRFVIPVGDFYRVGLRGFCKGRVQITFPHTIMLAGQNFGGAEAREFAGQARRVGEFKAGETPAGNFQRGRADAAVFNYQCDGQIFAAVGEQTLFN